MMEITEEIRAWIKRNAGTTKLDADEYIDASDGLIHCKNCKGSRQTIVPNFGKPGYLMPRCICACQIEAERRRKEADAQRERMERIKRRKAQGLQDRYLYDYTFANDNGQNPLMDKARAYVENWRRHTGTTPACFCLGMWELASPFSPVVSPTPCLTGMCRC